MENTNPLRILFVEDVPSDAILAEREIRKSGLEFSSQRVDTKDAFLKALEEFCPDVVVSDYSMPEFDGMRALNLLLEHDSTIPFVLLTGSVNEDTAVACLKAGAWDYVIKERMSRLPFAVQEALERKKERIAKEKAEQALRDSEERLRTFVDSATDLVFLKDSEYRYLLVNSANQKFFGKTESEILGKTDFDLMPQEMAQACHQSDLEAIGHNKIAVSLEQTNDRIFESRKFPVNQKDGKVGVGGFIRDVTDRQRAEEVVRKAEQQFRLVWENSADGMRLTNEEGKVLLVNDAFCRMVGKGQSEMEGKSLAVIYEKERQEHVVRRHHERFTSRTVEAHFDREISLWNGRKIWVEVANSFLESKGERSLLLGIFRDITERKQAEAALRLRGTALEAAANAIVITDCEGAIEWVNPAFSSLTGYALEECAGKNPRELVKSGKHDQVFYKDLWDKILAGETWQGRLTNRRKDGSLYTEQQTITPVRNVEGKVTHFIAIKENITERQRAEELLAESEKKFKWLFDYAPVAYHVLTPEGAITDVNVRWCEALGYSRDEVLGSPIFDFILAGERPIAKASFEAKKKEIASIRTKNERNYVARDGTVKTFLVGDYLTINEEGIVTSVQTTMEDITELKRVANALRESEGRYRSIFENIQDVYYESAVDGTILEVSPSIEILSKGQYRREDLIGKSMYDFYANPGERQTLLTAMQARGRVTDFEITLKNRDGSHVACSLSATIRTDDRGQKIFGSMSDITDRKRALRAFVESEAKYRTLVTQSPDGMFIMDLSGAFLSVNKAMCDNLKYSEAEFLAMKMWDIVPQRYAEIHQNRLAAIVQGKRIEGAAEYEVKAKDGNSLFIEVLSAPYYKDNVIVGFQGIARDVTERKRAEAALRLSEARLSSALTMAHLGHWEYDIASDLFTFNDHFYAMFRTTAEQVGGYTMSSSQYAQRFVHPDDMQLVGFETRKALETNNPHYSAQLEHRIFYADGEAGYINVRIFIVKDDQGRTIKTHGVNQDITERKEAERNLRLSEERFHSVWDNSADGIRLTDQEGKIVDVNPAFCRLVKMSREELMGQVLSVAYRRQGPEDDLSLYHERFDAGETLSNLFGSATLWNGESIALHISSSFIEGVDKQRLLLSLFRDVTEQRNSEKRVEEERNLLHTIIDAIPDEIAVKDTERRFILVNPAAVHALKRSSVEEIVGNRDEDLIPEQFALESKEEEGLVIATGCPTIHSVGKSQINPLTGEIERSILISKIPLKDSSGKVVGLVGINRDITEVQRASAELEKERTLLSTLIESIPDEICLKDAAHRFVVANNAVARAVGARSVKDILGKTDIDFTTPELAKMHFDEEDAIMASDHSIINLERTRLSPLTGEIERCLLTTKVPVKNKDGQKIGILVVNRYITERKKTEEALRASEEKYRALFEESSDAVYISSIDGRFLDINAAGVRLFGYDSRDEMLQVDLTSGIYADPIQRKRFRREMERSGFIKDYESTLRTKGGDTLTVLETATAVRDKVGMVKMYRGIIRDVTKQRMLERQFLQAQKMESIGTLAGGIAHDFNNILGIVLGHLALLERTRNNDAQFEESIFSITKAVERGASLVRQILTFARKTDTQLEPVNINATVKELAKMLEETFPKTMTMNLHLDKAVPAVSLDATQLHQALLNLSVNARDAMNGQGTLTLATKLVTGQEVAKRFPEAAANHYLRVSVMDTGAGMDDETKRRIFEPFFTTKEKGKGTGLGLAVVYGVLQAHHGFIDVESAKGEGSSFHLFFPVPEGILAPATTQTEMESDLPRGSETILVVEDEDILRDLLVKLLEMQGYHVIPASDGDEAVRRFSEHAGEIDLVLSDMGLPKRSGWDAFKAMQGTRVDVRALLASGYLDPGQKSEVLKSGVRGFIQKPYRMEEVLRAVREVLDAEG